MSEITYDRAVLVDVLVYHYRAGIKGCGCGWSELGRSWPAHVADVYEESVRARVSVMLDADRWWKLLRLACRLGWHNLSCRGRDDHMARGDRTVRR